jgi:hypothetical protein
MNQLSVKNQVNEKELVKTIRLFIKEGDLYPLLLDFPFSFVR